MFLIVQFFVSPSSATKKEARLSVQRMSFVPQNATSNSVPGSKLSLEQQDPIPLVNNRKGSLFLPSDPSLLHLQLLGSSDTGNSANLRLQRALSLPGKYRYHPKQPGFNRELCM